MTIQQQIGFRESAQTRKFPTKSYGLRSTGSFEGHSALYWGRLPTVLARRARPATTQALNQLGWSAFVQASFE